MKSLIRVSLLFAVLLALPALAQTPPVANADGTITGDLIGTLSGTVLTISAPGAPGTTPTLNNTNSPNPIRNGVTASIGGGALLAGACATGTASISGASTSMVPVTAASTSAAPGAAFYVKAQVTSANTVTVSVCAAIDGTPTASTYIVRVIG